jgi:Uncharacterised nucleotidyltransferase
VDLLVGRADLPAARAVVEGMGFSPAVVEGASRVSHLHAVAYRKPGSPELDLHAFALAEDPRPDADAGFLARAVSFESARGKLATLCAADHLLCACVHGLRFGDPPSIHWMADAVMIVRRAGSPAFWETLVAEARRRRLSLWAERALNLIRTAFDAPVPEGVLEALSQDRPGWLRRLELSARMRRPTITRGLFLHWCGLARERPHVSAIRRLGRFPRYLAEMWELDRVGQVPRAALRKSVRRLRPSA